MPESMRAMVISEQGGPIELVEREIPTPGPGEALVAVDACGVCHSDMFAKEGVYPGVSYPVVPGHEVAGRVAALGEGVTAWSEGQRVGVGWYAGNCGQCGACRAGDLIACADMGVTGVTFDGGYADYVLVRATALVAMPDDLSPEQAAPLLCAGVTTYHGLRKTGAVAGDTVAVLGIGGLGHLGVQYAAKMGFRVVAIARGTEKEQLALSLGAHHYVDSTASDPAEELQQLGGARVVLSTVTDGDAVAATLGGLAAGGEVVVVGAAEQPIPVPATALIGTNGSVRGSASGTAADSEDTLRFTTLSGVQARIETMPLERAAEAYQKMMDGDARFRMVLTT